jgi:hypothetical protein
MSFPVIPQKLSISAMRSSGYRDTAHALAELIDNSVQSGLEAARSTQVEVICIERSELGSARPRISEIAVLDNAGGMSPDILRAALQFGNGTRLDEAKHTGIGKFGMGLPNSSISQGERVDVWTWRNGLTVHSYIDVEEMRHERLVEVPEPKPSTVPSSWLRLFLNGIGKSGTLVVWSELDRITWKQSSTLLRHVEFLSGRIYRRFIQDKSVSIRLAAYEVGQGAYNSKWESLVRPNDPLYLMTGTNAPAPYDQRPAFDLYANKQLSVSYGGVVHEISIRASMAKPELRIPMGGSRNIGRHAKRNQGVSVMRAGRELELNKSFEVPDFRERWWGIEVDFPPALDDLFGVTNNKQSATAFQRMIFKDDAEAENMEPEVYRDLLRNEGDLRLPMYEISEEVDKLIRQMRAAIVKMRETDNISSGAETLSRKVERSATDYVKKRRDRVGSTGHSDRQEEEPEEVRTKLLTEDIIDDGVEPKRARDIAVDYVRTHTKFRVRHAALSSSAMFEVMAMGGVIVITFNTKHVVHGKVFAEFQKIGETSPLTKEVLSLMIAWARMEDEAASPQIRNMMEETREAWGRMAKDFFEPDEV